MSKKKKIGFGILGAFVALVIIALVVPSPPTTPPETAESPETFKASCITISYDSLARNTESYVGQRVYYHGEVIQVAEMGKDKYVLRVNVTEGEFGFWEDTIWVNYSGSRILEEDIVKIWGTVKGRRKYTAILGNEVVLPEIDAKYLELE